MKKILLLGILVFCANSFASEEKGKVKEEEKKVCSGKDANDPFCSGLFENKKDHELNCPAVLENFKCGKIDHFSRFFEKCCKLAAEQNPVNCKLSADKYFVYCKESSGDELVYQLFSEDGIMPVLASVAHGNKDRRDNMPYDSPRFYVHPDTVDIKCKMTPDKDVIFCPEQKNNSKDPKELTYILFGRDGIIPVSSKDFGQRNPLNIVPLNDKSWPLKNNHDDKK